MKLWSVVLAAVLVASWSIAQEKAKESAESEAGIAVVVVGVADDALVDAVAKSMKQAFVVPVRIKPAQQALADTSEKQAEALAKLMGKEDMCLVALMTVPEDVKFREYVLDSKHVGLLNVWALRPADPKRDVYEKRSIRESIRMAGKVLGLPVCAMPICVMSSSAKIDDLDAKTMGLCPPCSSKAEKVLNDLVQASQPAGK